MDPIMLEEIKELLKIYGGYKIDSAGDPRSRQCRPSIDKVYKYISS